MAYKELIRLRVIHAYYGDIPADLEVRPVDPAEFARSGLLLRRDGAEVVVLGDAGDQDRPGEVALAVLGEGPSLISATRAVGWDEIKAKRLTLTKDDWFFGEGRPAKIARPIGDQRTLGIVRIVLVPEDTRHITLRFEAEEVIWTYSILGSDPDYELEIYDPDTAIDFEDLGQKALPNGRSARVLRAQQPIPAKARPTQKFVLRHPGDFGPQTLVRVLPAAAIDALKPFHHADHSAQLQADIFVTLN